MPAPEVALVARARGIATHLVARLTLEALAGAGDVESLVHDLRRLGPTLDPIGDHADIVAVDRAVGRTAARHLQTLARWQTRRPGLLDVFFAELDRRAVRSLIRGAVQGAPAAARLEGLLPTPLLPQRALTELAHQPSAAAVVRHLVLLRYPDVASLLPLARPTQPDLLAIDVALLRGFARRARAAARQGDRYLRQYVSELVDFGNLQNALLLAGGSRDLPAETFFVDGGRWLSRAAFMRAAGATSRTHAAASLHATLAASFLNVLPLAGDAGRLERAFLVDALRRYSRAARREPLSSASVLTVLLRLDAQSRDLRAIAWSAALDIPPILRRPELVTPT